MSLLHVLLRMKRQRGFWNTHLSVPLPISWPTQQGLHHKFTKGTFSVTFWCKKILRGRRRVHSRMQQQPPRASSVCPALSTPGRKRMSTLQASLHQPRGYHYGTSEAEDSAEEGFPLISSDSRPSTKCLVYVQLPYIEDIRQYMFASLESNKKAIPTEEQLSAVDSLIDSMSLVQDDGESVEDLFKTSKIPNPQFQRLFQCLQHKAFNPDEPIPPIDDHIKCMLDRPEAVTAQCKAPLAKVKSRFPLQEAVKKKTQKTGQDIFKDTDDGEPDAKKGKMEDEEKEFSLATLAEGNITSVGSVNPDENFRYLMKQKNVNFSEVSQQLIDRIYEFLETKGLQYYMKSINCIKAFRQTAIKLSKAEQFNTFLRVLKDRVEERTLSDFWDIIVQDGLSLITKIEAGGSTVSSEEAKQFLAPKEKKEDISFNAGEEGGDVDDLLDMM